MNAGIVGKQMQALWVYQCRLCGYMNAGIMGTAELRYVEVVGTKKNTST